MHPITLGKPRVGFCRGMARKAFTRCSAAFAAGWPRDIRLATHLALPGFLVIELQTLPRGVTAIVDIEDRSIGVNAACAETEKRFAIAHEIGHVFMNHPEYVFSVEGKQDQILELEADVFAREFLMPLRTLKRAFRYCRDYESLAKKFCVSRHLMYRRFSETGLLRQVL